jgi:hypothetical protein
LPKILTLKFESNGIVKKTFLNKEKWKTNAPRQMLENLLINRTDRIEGKRKDLLKQEILNHVIIIFRHETTGFKVKMKNFSREMKNFNREAESFRQKMTDFSQKDVLRRGRKTPSRGKEITDRASYRKCR